ncbi:hypothetical protein AZE42_08394 [Rhizopogon vesiculosus]|uniref:Glutamate--cysteine ligase n=1 Tax=Rhizopogon vesiculosus TaxID=180088 RepID=A0A1J8R7T6_9AGAM|nr:hypothetical protein AZE42_08394 [Rhizopogon vesiculosus]
MTVEEIFVGKGSKFPGLLGLVEAYIDTLDVGSLQTPATWIRNFVRSHPSYKFDSSVSQEINYDLLVAVDEIERGVRRAPEMLPEDYRPSNGYHSGSTP